MSKRGSNHLRLATLALAATAVGCVAVYCVLPLLRHGVSFESDPEAAARLAGAAQINLSSSDMLLVVKDRALTLAQLSPQLIRRLEEGSVRVGSERDLPGLLPIVLLWGVAAAVGISLRRHPGADVGQISRGVSLLCLSVAATEFYLWYWTGAAGHNPPGVLADPLQRAGWKGSARELSYWYRFMLLLAPAWAAGMILFRRFLSDFLASDLMPLFVQGFFVLSALAVLPMFPPASYWSYIALSWWPLLFSLALLACNGACLYALRRLAARRPAGGAA